MSGASKSRFSTFCLAAAHATQFLTTSLRANECKQGIIISAKQLQLDLCSCRNGISTAFARSKKYLRWSPQSRLLPENGPDIFRPASQGQC